MENGVADGAEPVEQWMDGWRNFFTSMVEFAVADIRRDGKLVEMTFSDFERFFLQSSVVCMFEEANTRVRLEGRGIVFRFYRLLRWTLEHKGNLLLPNWKPWIWFRQYIIHNNHISDCPDIAYCCTGQFTSAVMRWN